MRNVLPILSLACLLFGCAGTTGIRPLGLAGDEPLELERFMGDWYVIAHIPLSPEANAYAEIERYALNPDGTIEVRLDFREGGFDGEEKTYTMKGWVADPTTNAEWRVQPIWPLRFRYQITELDPAYTRTVVEARQNAWIMARQPRIDEAELQAVIDRLTERGFPTDRLRRVPQR